jgi:hypothetical protein
LDDAYGRVVRTQKLILIDARRCVGRPAKDFQETLVHELAHAVLGPTEGHGPRFQDTLQRLLAFVRPDDEPAEVAARPTPRTGVMFSGRPVTWPGAGEWEFR